MKETHDETQLDQLVITVFCSTTDKKRVSRNLTKNTIRLFENISENIGVIAVNWLIDDEIIFNKFVSLGQRFSDDIKYFYLPNHQEIENPRNFSFPKLLKFRNQSNSISLLNDSIRLFTNAIDSVIKTTYNSRVLIVDFGIDLGSWSHPIYMIDPNLSEDYIYLPVVDTDSYYPAYWIFATKKLVSFFSTMDKVYSRHSAISLSKKEDVYHLKIKKGIFSRSISWCRWLYKRSRFENICALIIKSINPKNFFLRVIRKFIFEIDLFFGVPELTVENSLVSDKQVIWKHAQIDSRSSFGEFFKFFVWVEGQRNSIRFLDRHDFFNSI